MQGFSLLLRSNPDYWWEKLNKLFADVLVNPKYAAIVKSSAILTLGKLGFYMDSSNPFYNSIKNLLFELSKHDNILVSEPATYACFSYLQSILIHIFRCKFQSST